MSHAVVFTPEAEEDLAALYVYIKDEASPEIALRYTSAIIAHCESLREFPRRAVRRDDIRPGLHITHYKGRAVIAFTVDAERVAIIGVFYGGRDYESILRADVEAGWQQLEEGKVGDFDSAAIKRRGREKLGTKKGIGS